MAETSTASFVMHGARDAIADGLVHIEQQVEGVEQAVVNNPGLAFDLSRTLIESTCKTILEDRAVVYKKDENLPRLFSFTTQILSFLPPSESGASEVGKSLRQTLNGLHTAVQGICELRNQCGFASHGSGSPRPAMEAAQALLAAKAADTIVGFLYHVHRQRYAIQPVPEQTYKDHNDFNESLDEAFGPFKIHDMEFRPSEVLHNLEPDTYRIYLAEFEDSDDSIADDSASSEVQP